MALTVTQSGGFRNISREGKKAKFQVSIAASGSYPGSNGDTLDLRGYGVPGNSVPTKVTIRGRGAGVYAYVPGTNRGNGQMRVMVVSAAGANQVLTEHTATSYVAGITGDTIIADVEVDLFAAA